MTQTRRLYRSRKDEQISGVCAGLAEYFGLDATWVRVAFVLITLINGVGLLLYIILALVIPKEPSENEAATSARSRSWPPMPTSRSSPPMPSAEQTLREGAANLKEKATQLSGPMLEGNRPHLLGWALVAVGAWFLLQQLGWFRINDDYIWPLILIGLGVVIVLRNR